MRSSLGCGVRCWICTNRHSGCREIGRFLDSPDSPRQGRERSARARIAICMNERQRAHETKGRGRERKGLEMRSVKFSVPTGEIRSTIMVSDSIPFLPIMDLNC